MEALARKKQYQYPFNAHSAGTLNQLTKQVKKQIFVMHLWLD